MTATLKTTIIKDPSATVDNITLDASGNVTLGGSLALASDLSVADGGTGASSFNAYGVVAGGTTGTGALQSLSSTGTSGQVLTSQGAGSLPAWADAAGGGVEYVGAISSSSTSWSNLTNISQYKSLMIMVGSAVANSGTGARLRISDSNGASWGGTWTVVTVLDPTAFAYATVFVTNTDQTSTNKTLYINYAYLSNADAATGSFGSAIDTNTETTETGIIDAVGVSMSSGSGRGVINATVYGLL